MPARIGSGLGRPCLRSFGFVRLRAGLMRPVRAAGSRWGGSPSPWPGDLPRQHRIMVHWALGGLRPSCAAKKPVCRRAATPVLGHDRHKAAPDPRFCPSGHSHPKQKMTPSPQRQCRRRTGRAISPCSLTAGSLRPRRQIQQDSGGNLPAPPPFGGGWVGVRSAGIEHARHPAVFPATKPPCRAAASGSVSQYRASAKGDCPC